MFIKICGITRRDDALHAAEHGATALGFVFWPKSPRYVTPEQAASVIQALPSAVTAVGVFVNETVDGIRDIVARTGIGAVQLHGDEAPAYARELGWPILRAVTVDAADRTCAEWPSDTTFLVDAADAVRRGGTGAVVDWGKAAPLARQCRLVLAGGLNDSNVKDAVAIVRPFGVDVSSGVEDAPGVKNRDKMTRFLDSARSALEQR
jgi:phosphoribosylanthranilate isomerase